MNERDLDDLLEQRLKGGQRPGDGPPEDDDLVGTAEALRAAGRTAEREAAASLPIARARFERYLAGASRPQPVAVKKPTGRWSFGMPGPMRFVSAAGIAVIAIALAVIVGANFRGAETASALTPGDYVQLEGVVESTFPLPEGQRIRLTSEVADQDLTVTTDQTTALLDGTAATEIKPGDGVLIGGVVGDDRIIAASTLVRSGATGQAPQRMKLKDLSGTLSGRIVSFALARDGKLARVVLDDGKGNRYLVPITPRAAEVLLNSAATAVGLRVTVTRNDGPGKPFSVEISKETPGNGANPGRPGFSGISGVIVGREANTLRVDTPKGMIAVVIRPATRILLSQSGLILEEVLTGKASAIGHTVSVSGALDASGRRLLADVVVVGPRGPGK